MAPPPILVSDLLAPSGALVLIMVYNIHITYIFYIYVMATSFFYIYVVATSFFYIYVKALTFTLTFTSALREWVLDSREVKSEEKMSFTLFEKCK